MYTMKLIKKAKEWGNGAGVRVPRDWLGMEVEVKPLVPLGIEEIQREVLQRVNPYLANIQGVYLAGSYARGEQVNHSDIDILAITDKPIKIPKKEPYDIYAISKDKLNKIIRYYPLQVMSMIQEAKPIINSALLEDLKKIELKPRYFKEHLESTKEALKIIENLIEGYEDSDLAQASLIYPLILRLRGLYLVEALLKNREYRNSHVKSDIEKLGISMERVENIYKIYQIKRDIKKNLKHDITIGEAKKIYNMALKKYGEIIKWLNEK